MNIIITGPKRCGKSTVLQKLLPRLGGKKSGFITSFPDRSAEDKCLLISSLDGSLGRCAVKWKSGVPDVDRAAFDTFAPSLIDISSDYVVIDELGKFEKSSESLKSAVEAAFDAPCHVIASIRLDADGWMQALKSREDVTVLTLNGLNRDSIPDRIQSLIDPC